MGTLAFLFVIGYGIYYCDPKRSRGGKSNQGKTSLLMTRTKAPPVIEADEEYHAM